MLEIIFPWVNIAPFGFPGRKNKDEEATVISRKTEKPHQVTWSPVVPEVKQISARSSGAGGCNQIRRERMNRVATANDKTLNFGTPSSSPDSKMIKDEGIGSGANSPLVQRGCLFPEPVKIKTREIESARACSLVSNSTTDYKLKQPYHTSNSLKLITSTSHSCARFTRSVSKASMITIIFTGVPLPLTHSRIIQAFSGTSQITVAMVAATEQTVLKDPLCSNVSDPAQHDRPAGGLRYLCRWCGWWPLYPECHTAEPSPGSTCNRPILK